MIFGSSIFRSSFVIREREFILEVQRIPVWILVRTVRVISWIVLQPLPK